MEIAIIAAVSVGNFAIGYKGDLCYRISDDLKRFKELTMGHTIIMGSKTFDSLPDGKALEGRKNIVLSTCDPGSRDFPGVSLVCPSLEAALRVCENEDIVFIIGGGSVYKQALPLADTLYLTEIFATPMRSDTYFPSYHGDFTCVERHYRVDSGLRYEFTVYKRDREEI